MHSLDNRIIALKEFVPQKLGFVVLLFFVFSFQFTSDTYLSILNNVACANQFSSEDLEMAFHASMIGMTMIFPIMFRVKFRFKSKYILLTAVSAVLLLSIVSTLTTNIVVLTVAGFFLGAFRMLGTFESFSSIQLKITPTRDFGLFFTIVYTVILSCIHISGIFAVHLNFWYGWHTMHYVMLGVHAFVLLLILVLFRPIHFMPPIPFRGIDFRGLFLWTSLFMAISYVAIYGHEKDWFESTEIFVASIAILVFGILLLWSYKTTSKPFIQAKAFTFRNVIVSCILLFLMAFFVNTGESILYPFTQIVMGLDSLSSINLNIFISAGILVGSRFCWWWFSKINGDYKVLFFVGFFSLILYHILIGNLLSVSASKEVLYLPYFFKGLGYLIIFATIGKYMMKDVPFEIFPQTLFVVAVMRDAVGGIVASSILTNWQNHKVIDYLNKLATNVHTSTIKLPTEALYGKTYVQSLMLSVRDIFGTITILGIVILIGLLLFHFSRPFVVRHFGNKFWRG